MAGKPARRQRRYWSDDNSDTDDRSSCNSDSEIESEVRDLEMAVDFEKEGARKGWSLNEILGRRTNAIDCEGGDGLDSDGDSDSSSGSSSSGSLIDD